MKNDKERLPEHYTHIDNPYYPGDGELNVLQLEELCKKFKEFTHQQQIIKQSLYHELEG